MNKTIYKFSIIIILIFLIVSRERSELTLDSVPSKYLLIDDFNIHYKEYGKGDKTLIFIHGWGCDMNTWKYQFNHFKDKHHMLLIDLPGYGQSDKPEKEYTIDFFAQSVLKLVDYLDIKKPVLIAHSMGFPVAIEILRQMKSEGAMLCNIDGVYFDFPEDSIEKLQYNEGLNDFVKMFKGENYEKNVHRFCEGFITETTPTYVSDYIISVMTRTPERIGFQTMISLIDEKYWDKKIIENKTIAIYAKIADLSLDNEKILRKQFPILRYVEMDRVNHFLMMEKPIKVNKILEEFIDQ